MAFYTRSTQNLAGLGPVKAHLKEYSQNYLSYKQAEDPMGAIATPVKAVWCAGDKQSSQLPAMVSDRK